MRPCDSSLTDVSPSTPDESLAGADEPLLALQL
jgi:hypothetical protein